MIRSQRWLLHWGYCKLHTEGCILSTDTNNKHVERHLSLGDVTLDFGVVADVHDTLLVVNLGRLGFVELDVGIFLASDVTDRLHNRAVFDQTRGAGRQQRGEKEVVTGGNDDDIVVLGIQLLQKGNRAPSGTCAGLIACPHCVTISMAKKQDLGYPTQDHQGLLLGVGCNLLNWMTELIDAVCHITSETETGEQGQAPGPAQEPESFLGLRRGRGVSVRTASSALNGLLGETAGSQGTSGAKDLRARRERPARQRRHD